MSWYWTVLLIFAYVLIGTCIILNQNNGEILRESEYHKTYEEACEAAIKYCLENLI